MKLTILFMILACLQVSADSSGQKLTLSEHDVPVRKIFRQIRSQTAYNIIYNSDMLDDRRRTSIDIKDAAVTETLTKLLRQFHLSFQIVNKTIFLKKENQSNADDNTPASTPVGMVKGRVVNPKGEPLPGATIQVKGTGTVAVADDRGAFEISNVASDATLVISSLGHETKEIPVAGKSFLEITLNEKLSSLSETVVIAYGSQKRKDITGSVSTISSEQLADISPAATLAQALQGRASGVYVVQESGAPGAATRVRIRGASSLLGSNQPLYVIDGIPVTDESSLPADGSAFNNELLQEGLSSPISNLNPSDIASITILKDASATAIYGSRAANGVVMITTRHGSATGKPKYMLNASISSQRAVTDDVLNADQFRELWTEAARNSTSTAAIVQQIQDGSYFGHANTNWEKAVSPADPLTKLLTFSVSGGNKDVRYFTSLGANNQNGTFDNSYFKRYNLLSNLDLSVSRHITLGTSINMSTSRQSAPDGGLLTRIYNFRPDLPVYDDDGNYSYSDFYNLENPVALSKAYNRTNTSLLLGSVYGELRFAKHFKLRSALSVNYGNTHAKDYYPSFTLTGGWSRTGGPGDGFAKEMRAETVSTLWENTLTYDQYFGVKHHVDGVAGASWQNNVKAFLTASGEGFPQDEILTNLSSAASDYLIYSYKSQYGLISYFGRLNYAYNDRYMLSVSARTDGSSKFAVDNKWAFFPTVAVAWRISDESFMHSWKFLNELKLRASTGVTGQQNFDAYQWRTLFSASSYGGDPAVLQSQLGNSRLKWERTTQNNFGLDFAMLNDRLHGVFDYYDRKTRDLLYFVKVPGNTGYASAIGNLGDTRNKGIEITLDGDIVRGKSFSWNLSINVSHNTNRLVKLNDDYLNTTSGVITPPNTGSVLKVGEPLGLIYGYIADGIINSSGQLDALNHAAPDGTYQNTGTAPGDILFRDISGPDGEPDGQITTLDQTVIGNAQPDFSGGFTSTWNYKGLRLSVLFTYSVGNDLRWGTLGYGINYNSTFTAENKIALALKRWTPEHHTDIPRAVYGDPNQNYRISSYYVYDAGFLRLKNVHLSYALPEKLLSRAGFISSAMVYVSGANLLTFTKYPGANPETSNLYNDDVSTGLDNSRFPIARMYTAGIRLGF